MPAQDAKTLEFNECLKSDKMPYIINADLESMIKRIDECKNNPEKSSVTKIGEHIPCGYSIYTMYTEVKTMKKICESLIEHAMEIINFEKKKMIPVTKGQRELREKSKICYICRRKFIQKCASGKNYHKLRDHCYYTGKHSGAAHSLYNLKHNVPNEILVVFRNKSKFLTNVYCFIIKELANEFER